MERLTAERSSVLPAVLGALVFVLGVQSMRYLFASIAWYLRDTVGVATLDLIPIALAPFVAGLLVPLVSRLAGYRVALWVGVGGLIAARLVNQLVGDPGVGLWAAGIATAAGVGLLPLLLGLGRAALVAGVLLGITVDTAIKDLGLSLDLVYQPGVGPTIVVLALAAATVWTLLQIDLLEPRGVKWGAGALLLGLGPYLFAQYVVFQSQGWTSEAGSVSAAHAVVRIALLNVAALYVASRWGRSRPVLLVSALVVGGALLAAESSPAVFNVLSVPAVVAAGPVWAAMVPDLERRSLGASAAYLVGGATLFLGLGLSYYLPMDLDLGFTQSQLRVAAAILLTVFALAGALTRPASEVGVARAVPVLGAVTLVFPLIAFLTLVMADPTPAATDAAPVRFMTYNLHSAFNTDGAMDVEAIARVIEDSEATVVGLQEVPRGRLLNAGTDLLTLLVHRLGFEHVAFFGTTDPVWGNAILSRFPLGDVETEYLPTGGTPLRRGYLAVPVRVAGGEVLFISTHLQHINDSDAHEVDPEGDLLPVHRLQIATILDEWDGRTPAVLVGDFNARPGWTQMEELLAAGWVDSWDEAGQGPGYTSGAADPQHRIDWILHTPDLVATDAGVFQSQASDHFAVIAEIEPDGR